MPSFTVKSKYSIGDRLRVKTPFREYSMVVEAIQFVVGGARLQVMYYPEDYKEDVASESDVVRKLVPRRNGGA